MKFPEQPAAPPGTLGSVGSLRARFRGAGGVLLVNLLLGCLFFLELQWYIENVYRHNPWIPFVSPENIDTVIDLLWGAFLLHLPGGVSRS